jgi:hypothetical protein
MIKLFRNIRQNLLAEGKTKRYLKYAIGEIILVVIGILIALQVNDWNENRKFISEKQRIVNELQKAFINNKMVLKERIEALENANANVITILSHTGQNFSNQKNWDSIIGASLKYGNYNPANSTLSELINSGQLSKVVDASLKENLYKWMLLLEDSDEDFKNQDLQATTLLIPHLYDNISMQNLNVYNQTMDVKQKSERFDDDYQKVFDNLKFENLYQGKLFWNTIMLNHYKELDKLATVILGQTK